MLVCRDISLTYQLGDGVVARPLQGLNLVVSAGGTALMGPSGSGKTTLLRIIAGLLKPDCGDVRIDDHPVRHLSRDPQADRRVAMVQQDYGLLSFLTVAQNMQINRELRGLPRADAETIEAALERVKLGGYGARLPGTLSGGQRQRVAIARGLVSGARVILADEPTGALDAAATDLVAACLADVAVTSEQIVLVATHDHRVADAMGSVVALAELMPAVGV